MTEPVAFINVEKRTLEWARPTRWETSTIVVMDKVPLYTKKEWVGLTDEERREIISDTERDDRGYVMALVEAKLKEKNG